MQKALFIPSQPEPDYHVNPARDGHFEEKGGGGERVGALSRHNQVQQVHPKKKK